MLILCVLKNLIGNFDLMQVWKKKCFQISTRQIKDFYFFQHWASGSFTEHLRQLKENMQRAFHFLALFRDAKVLLTVSASEIDRVIFLSEALSYAMAGSERYNASQLSNGTIGPRLPG